jgi:hypothetical protein
MTNQKITTGISVVAVVSGAINVYVGLRSGWRLPLPTSDDCSFIY